MTPSTSPLLDPEPLLESLRHGPAGVTLLDVRWRLGRDDGAEEHAAGHLPGAAYVDLPVDLADPPGDPVDDRGRHPLPDPERLGRAMRAAGVRAERPVVVYDAVGGTSAARAWWLLRHHGHRDVRVLDGGWQVWLALGGPVETGPVAAETGDWEPVAGVLPVLDAGGAAAAARAGLLVDARTPERFGGLVEPVDPVAGHIPGARNVPTALNLEPEGPRAGRFRAPAALRQVYAEVLGRPGPVGVSCGSGVTAAHDALALAVLGVDAALYPGSWSGWVSDPTRPVA